MNDINSVLLEGTIDKSERDEKHNRSYVELHNFVKSRRPYGMAVCNNLRIDVTSHDQIQRELIPGRKIRIVGRLERIGRAMTVIVADHIELKPVVAG